MTWVLCDNSPLTPQTPTPPLQLAYSHKILRGKKRHFWLTITIILNLQLGPSTGHHHRSAGPQQDRLRRVRGVGGLVLGEDPRFQPRPVDAADGEDLGVHGVPHAASHLHPDQEAHPLGGEEPPELLQRARSSLRQLQWQWMYCMLNGLIANSSM